MTNGDPASVFLDKSGIKAGDMDHRQKINYNIGKYNAVVPVGKQQYDKINLARKEQKYQVESP
jgi:L-lactate dehydrogenase complex protein LldF